MAAKVTIIEIVIDLRDDPETIAAAIATIANVLAPREEIAPPRAKSSSAE